MQCVCQARLHLMSASRFELRWAQHATRCCHTQIQFRLCGCCRMPAGDEAAQADAARAADIFVASAHSDSASGSSAARASATSSGPAATPTTATASSTAPASTPTGPTVVSTAPAAATPAPATTPNAPAGSAGNAAAGNTAADNWTTLNTVQEKGSPLVASAADIKVAAAAGRRHRRRLQAADTWGVGRVVSSFSSSSGDGRRSQAVAVASLDCNAADSELYIAA